MSFLQLVSSLDKTIRDLILFCRQCHSDPYRNMLLQGVPGSSTMKIKHFEMQLTNGRRVSIGGLRLMRTDGLDNVHGRD